MSWRTRRRGTSRQRGIRFKTKRKVVGFAIAFKSMKVEKVSEKEKPIQCKYCIHVLRGEVRYARHVATKHPEHVGDYIKGDERIVFPNSETAQKVLETENVKPLIVPDKPAKRVPMDGGTTPLLHPAKVEQRKAVFEGSFCKEWRYDNNSKTYAEGKSRTFYKLRHPRFIRFRSDKKVCPDDLRLEQVRNGE